MSDLKLAGRYTADTAAKWAWELVGALKEYGVKHFVTVPDSILGSILAVAEADPDLRLTSVHREEEAVGVLCGLYLGGERGAMVIQSSGLGNCLNALGSMAMVAKIPFPIIIGLRGELGEFNPAQFAMGRAVPGCLTALGIQHFSISHPEDVPAVVGGAAKSCFAVEEPIGLLLSAQLTGSRVRTRDREG
jgi:sulfopyruvate decarboxylase alpha subunit